MVLMPQYGYSAPLFPALSAWLDSPMGFDVAGGADEGVIGGSCVDSKGVLGPAGAKVSCSALRAALEGKNPSTYREYETIPDGGALEQIAELIDGEAPAAATPALKPEIPKWLYGVAVAAVGAVAFTLWTRKK